MQDPTLNQLVEQALANSPSMKMADSRLRQARSIVGLNESTLGPQVDANASRSRERYSLYGILPPPLAGSYQNLYTLSLNANWEIDFWGKNRAEVAAALGNQRAVAYEGEQTRLVLTQAVIAQYTGLQHSQGTGTLAQPAVKVGRNPAGAAQGAGKRRTAVGRHPAPERDPDQSLATASQPVA
ncbi:TolC family protein [Paludibacterium denitrificans]|uniref:Outer membrane efflux protein n=1 Tax=Paludibacterium denitrificans TaxID=2675226 RepID=A0A844GEF7_9NEIS|nr:TolC family protein [Paludibacterium denitrificans]MTD33297.1 hypothetical protein [Paludibacterium denitrificans]